MLSNGRTKKGYHGYVDGIRPIPMYLVGVVYALVPPILYIAVSFSHLYLYMKNGGGSSETER